MDETAYEKRVAALSDRLADRHIAARAPPTAIEQYATPAFFDPEALPRDEFSSCDVGFAWERDRQYTLADRRTADVDVRDASDLPAALSIGTTMWVRLELSIPDAMAGYPVSLRFVVTPERPAGGPLGGDVRAEGLCYRDGEPIGAFDNGHAEIRLTDEAAGGERIALLVEVGATTLWGNLDVEGFVLREATLVAEREAVAALDRQVTVLDDLRETLPAEDPNRGKIARAVVEAAHAIDFEGDDGTFESSVRQALADLEAVASELDSSLSDYTVTTVGHAHIDLAWLWPWSETVRKAGRSFSTVLGLMDDYPEFTFVQSQPHLYEFLRDRYPGLDERIAERVETGQWQPTGALWVESDVNLVGPESLARQYLYGTRYFRERFDTDPQITFIPDVFGYSAALPGIARAADCPYFFTQKMSWNEVNDFPHTTFEWEGIDGSSVLAHFPPAETYNGRMSVEEVRESVTNLRENDVVEESAYLVGWGDGGGGPTREMLERRRTMNDVGALPDVEFGSLEGVFERLADDIAELPTWTGELYLEKHRGTLTSQARTKRHNRQAEFALRDAELWSAFAHAEMVAAEDGESLADDDDVASGEGALEDAWKLLLFHQFHDILPGSSIPEVYADADREFDRLFDIVETERDRALDALLPSADPDRDADDVTHVAVTNALSWSRSPIVTVGRDAIASVAEADALQARAPDGTAVPVQASEDGFTFRAPDVPGLGVESYAIEPADEAPADPLIATADRLENDHVRVTFREDGTVNVYDKDADRAVLEGGGNRLVCYRDQPAEFEAWDLEADVYDVSEDVPPPAETTVTERGPVRASVRQIRTIGDSRIEQEIRLERGHKRITFETTVEWHEDERLLKAHFPMAVHATSATYDIQFGHYERPTHDNTSWDAARYEEPHQKWVDVSEPGYGAALLNDGKYGVHVDGTDVGLSLLRAPRSPDPEADRGTQTVTYALYPHDGDHVAGRVERRGYEVNAPVATRPVAEPVERNPIDLVGEGVVVEAIKRAEDDPRELIVRCYEAHGRETTATLSTAWPIEAARECSLIEDTRTSLAVETDSLTLTFDAFEIKTVGLTLAGE